MATFIRVTSDGSLRTIVLPFTSQYNGQDVTVTAITGSIPNWGLSGNTVVFSSNVAAGTVVQVARNTPVNIRYKFSQGAAFTAGNLDFDLQQLLNISEEARDLASSGVVGNMNMQGNRIVNLGSPQDLSDAATKQYVDDAVSSARGQDYSNTLRSIETRVSVLESRSEAHGLDLTGLTNRVRTLEGVQSPLPNGFFQNGKINPEYLPKQQQQDGGGGSSANAWRYGLERFDVAAPTVTQYDLWLRAADTQDSGKSFRALWFRDAAYNTTVPNSDRTTYLINYQEWEQNPGIHAGKSRLVFYKELTDVKTELTDVTNSLRNRVNLLEQSGSGGGGGSGSGGGSGLYIDGTGVARIDNAILRGIRQPEYETDAVNLKFFQEALATEHEVLAEQATTQARAVAVEIRDRILSTERTVDALSASVEALKAGGGAQPQPSPSPAPAPSGGSGISMGMMALPRASAKAFVNGVPKPSTGVTGSNTNYVFTLTPGLWEFRVHAKGGNVTNVSFVGSGTLTTSFSEYTVHTVQNCTQVTVTLPNPGTWSFGISGVYLGAQVG